MSTRDSWAALHTGPRTEAVVRENVRSSPIYRPGAGTGAGGGEGGGGAGLGGRGAVPLYNLMRSGDRRNLRTQLWHWLRFAAARLRAALTRDLFDSNLSPTEMADLPSRAALDERAPFFVVPRHRDYLAKSSPSAYGEAGLMGSAGCSSLLRSDSIRTASIGASLPLLADKGQNRKRPNPEALWRWRLPGG